MKKPPGDPVDPDDPCSPRVEVIDGERWTSPVAHKLRDQYELGGEGRLKYVVCKRCGRLWSTIEITVSGEPVASGPPAS